MGAEVHLYCLREDGGVESGAGGAEVHFVVNTLPTAQHHGLGPVGVKVHFRNHTPAHRPVSWDGICPCPGAFCPDTPLSHRPRVWGGVGSIRHFIFVVAAVTCATVPHVGGVVTENIDLE